jgi:hypothetical protein
MAPSGKSKKTSRKSEKVKRSESKRGVTKRSKSTGKEIENMEERMPYAKSHETKPENMAVVNTKPHYIYKSESTQWSSTPAPGQPFGKRTIVDVQNEHGIKRSEILNESGKTVERTTEPLKLGRAQTRPGLFLLHRALFL